MYSLKNHLKLSFAFTAQIIIVTMFLTSACLCTFLFSSRDFIADVSRRWPRLSDVPMAQEQFDTTVEYVTQNVPDQLIEEQVVETVDALSGELMAGCIRGATDLIYGSNNDFEYILAYYETILPPENEWDWRPEVSIFSREQITIVLDRIDSSHPSYIPECEEFHVCYKARVYFADPSLASCSG